VGKALTTGEPIDGLLRRKTVKATTATLYTGIAQSFLLRNGLTAHSAPEDIDKALDMEMVELYLQGESAAESNLLYYGTRWYTVRTNADLRLSFRSRQGHCRSQFRRRILPETWEAVLLQCAALMDDVSGAGPRLEAARACCGWLLSFDTYARATELLEAARKELRPPLGSAARKAGGFWTLTLFPSTHVEEAKNKLQDVTKMVGATDERRRWLTHLLRPLLRSGLGQDRLLGPLNPGRYLKLFHRSRVLASLQPSHPHRLRHGGASLDGLDQNIGDQTLQDRGGWKSVKSIAIYRQPARYLRELEKLSSRQRLDAACLPTRLQTVLVGALRSRP